MPSSAVTKERLCRSLPRHDPLPQARRGVSLSMRRAMVEESAVRRCRPRAALPQHREQVGSRDDPTTALDPLRSGSRSTPSHWQRDGSSWRVVRQCDAIVVPSIALAPSHASRRIDRHGASAVRSTTQRRRKNLRYLLRERRTSHRLDEGRVARRTTHVPCSPARAWLTTITRTAAGSP